MRNQNHLSSLIIAMYKTPGSKTETEYSIIEYHSNKKTISKISRIKLKYYFKKSLLEKKEIKVSKSSIVSQTKTSFIQIAIYDKTKN